MRWRILRRIILTWTRLLSMVSIQEQVMMTRVRYLCAKEFSTLCSSVHTCLNLCKPNSFRLVQTGPNLFKLVQTYPNLSKLFRNKLNHSYIFFYFRRAYHIAISCLHYLCAKKLSTLCSSVHSGLEFRKGHGSPIGL